ncbi:transposase (fragment) [Xenorhabdus doucetiae]|uniref:Transposase n=1 Tax=Xenorhabdus doucetiae TaxID=351671 RepID=A0A068QM80_9GAMM
MRKTYASDISREVFMKIEPLLSVTGSAHTPEKWMSTRYFVHCYI